MLASKKVSVKSTILSSPKISCALFRFLRALRARKIFDALRPIYYGSMAQN